MVGIISITIYILIATISLVSAITIFYHFKKFNLPDDKNAQQILSIFKWGIIFFLFVSFAFLILFIIYD